MAEARSKTQFPSCALYVYCKKYVDNKNKMNDILIRVIKYVIQDYSNKYY